MNSITTSRDPSTKQRRSLALALGSLGVVIGLMIWLKPVSLLVIASLSLVAWCASMAFNEEEPREHRWLGLLVPLTFGLIYVAARYVATPTTVAVAAAIALAALGVAVWIGERFGNEFYNTWAQMFLPLAWTVSTVLLILVYYLVLTPIGLALRLAGRDRMGRRFDSDRTTYWVKRNESDPSRYFRQF